MSYRFPEWVPERDIILQLRLQLRRYTPMWDPAGRCRIHHLRRCEKDWQRRGRVIALDCCGLQLTQLPPEILQLSSLQYLYLADNQLSTLPAELGQLSSLRELDLSDNQLSTLPAELGQLSSLQKLYLDHNPLQSPLSEIVVEGTSTLLAYLRTQQNADAEATEVKPSESTHSPVMTSETLAEQSLTNARETRSITLFYCYAHEDRELRDRIDKHLGVLKRLGQVTEWFDREIQAGTEWEREIQAHLDTANVILLLVSVDFINSDYCYGVEMQKALEMHKKGKARILPILLRPVDWQDAPFAKLQLLPTGAKPITSWPDPEEALEDVAKQIRAVVTTLRTRQG